MLPLLLTLVVLADPADSGSGFERAERLAELMMKAKAYDGRYGASFDEKTGRIVVSFYGKAAWPSRARKAVDAAIEAAPQLADVSITLVYFFDECGTGYELIRRTSGEFIETKAPKRARSLFANPCRQDP